MQTQSQSVLLQLIKYFFSQGERVHIMKELSKMEMAQFIVKRRFPHVSESTLTSYLSYYFNELTLEEVINKYERCLS